ncbi:LYR motif-containing protein 4 [Microplitis demolitor]|uniref:LYR motif-containing protein 4 n=1 Tax=Microplitis demolitor TaxID=69319 RepID=UPI0004CCCBFB|nr:LYR motif-containing protein 4 [Microplitis demolitor]
MAYGREAVLKLYRNLIRESQKWSSYNYREYALRKVRDEFRENKTLQDNNLIQDCYNKGLENLEIIKRQVILSNLYGTRPLVIENKHLGQDKVHPGAK